MIKWKFEYKITLAYILIGGIWIIFSDKLLDSIIEDRDSLTKIQTSKGWFYVIITALLFFMFLKKHLTRLRNAEQELEKHRNNLELLVEEKTKKLDHAIKELRVTNEELHSKNNIINKQNQKLKEILHQLHETQSHLFQAEKMASLGILTTGLAHEINNPLHYILGGLTGLEKYFKAENHQDEKINLFINSIKTGIDKASSIVSKLNLLSKNQETYEEDCDIHKIIDNCLSIIDNQLTNKIEIFKNFSDKDLIISGNVALLHQVFINILINASQSIKNKGSISIMTEEKDDMVYIKISDTGCGIIKKNLSKIIDPFFTTKEPGEGTGLGLSISYNIIQAHKGKISFQSEHNKGTIVDIVLPKKTEKHE